jgi:glycosyltransferase involved in cell wall biosynthesis
VVAARMTEHSLRVLWHSVAPFISSGYGVVTKNVALRLGKHFPLLISTYYGMHVGGSLRIGGVRVVPTEEVDYGRISVIEYIKKFNIQLPILASDFWPFRWFALLPNSMFYGPVDSYDYIDDDIETMRLFTYFIPCSKFGGKVYERLTGRKPLAVIPHGVDTKVFKPYDKQECRKILSLPQDKFIWGIVAANSDPEPRKGWDDMFFALGEFKERFPEEANKWIVFAFSKPSDSRGYDLVSMAKKVGLGKQVYFPEYLPQVIGLPDIEMAKLYSCFDVLLNASRREGFCLPVLEAQACGVPVIASSTSALPELVAGHGWLVRMRDKVFAPRGWICKKVDREDLVKKLEEAYFDDEKRKEYSVKALEFAKNYDWDKLVNEQWVPLLTQLEGKQSLNKLA